MLGEIMSRVKKLSKSDGMDEWLEAQGLYRKHTAKDGSCLFRAVAEQVFRTQAHHEKVRRSCVDFMELNSERFQEFIEGPFDHHLYNLLNPKEWGGHVEMFAMSLMYERDFLVYQEPGQEAYNATENGFEEKIVLCFSQCNHYDSVYQRTLIANAAVCQSIVYNILYKSVFSLGDDIDLAVEKMLHDKVYAKHRKDSTTSQDSNWDKSNSPSPDFLLESETELNEEWKGCSEIRRLLACGIPPFPYKVAKALDPDIYRNVEYDVWNEQKKDEPQFEPGTKCLVKLDNEPNGIYHAHVQEIHDDKGPVTVFIEELGEKLTIAYEALEPLPASSQRQFDNKWQSPGKNFKLLTGYYPKSGLNGHFSDYDKLKGKKKLSKKKIRDTQVPMPIVVTRGHGLPPRLQYNQVDSSYTGKNRNMTANISLPRSPSPRMKWNQTGPPNHRFRQKHNSGSRFMIQNGLSPQPGLDSNYSMVEKNGLDCSGDHDSSHFPALPNSQGNMPPQVAAGVWNKHQNLGNNYNGMNTMDTHVPNNSSQVYVSTKNQCLSSDIHSLDNDKFSQAVPEYVVHSSPIPIMQPSPAHPMSSCVPLSPCSLSMPSMSTPPHTQSTSPNEPIRVPSSAFSSAQSISQGLSSQSSMIVAGQPQQPPPTMTSSSSQSIGQLPHSMHQTSLQQQQPPPYSYFPMPSIFSGMLVPVSDNPSQPINFNVGRSQDLNGNDLPLGDIPTLRFFFNLGCDYFRMTNMIPVQQQSPYPLWSVSNQMSYPTSSQLLGPENEDLFDDSCGNNGFYQNPGSPPTMLASSPTVYYNNGPYLYHQPPQGVGNSVPQQIPFTPAGVI